MTLEDLLEKLRSLEDSDDPETDDPEGAHRRADDLLIAYIDNEDVRRAFNAVPKWYA